MSKSGFKFRLDQVVTLVDWPANSLLNPNRYWVLTRDHSFIGPRYGLMSIDYPSGATLRPVIDWHAYEDEMEKWNDA